MDMDHLRNFARYPGSPAENLTRQTGDGQRSAFRGTSRVPRIFPQINMNFAVFLSLVSIIKHMYVLTVMGAPTMFLFLCQHVMKPCIHQLNHHNHLLIKCCV